MAKYKVGDKFKFHGGTREIVGVYGKSDFVRYWIAYDSSNDLDTLSEDYIDDNYTKIEPFFEVGKTYRQRDGWQGYRYKVFGLHSYGGKLYALAEVSIDGNPYKPMFISNLKAFAEV